MYYNITTPLHAHTSQICSYYTMILVLLKKKKTTKPLARGPQPFLLFDQYFIQVDCYSNLLFNWQFYRNLFKNRILFLTYLLAQSELCRMLENKPSYFLQSSNAQFFFQGFLKYYCGLPVHGLTKFLYELRFESHCSL